MIAGYKNRDKALPVRTQPTENNENTHRKKKKKVTKKERFGKKSAKKKMKEFKTQMRQAGSAAGGCGTTEAVGQAATRSRAES